MRLHKHCQVPTWGTFVRHPVTLIHDYDHDRLHATLAECQIGFARKLCLTRTEALSTLHAEV